MEAKINQFAKEWAESLNRDDTMALTMFLYSYISGVSFSVHPMLFC